MKYEYRKNTQMLVDSQSTVTNIARENGWQLGNLDMLKKKKRVSRDRS